MSPIRSRTATLFSVAAFLLVAILATGVYWQVRQQDRNLLQSQCDLTAKQIAIRMEQFFDSRLAIAKTIRDELQSGRIASRDHFIAHVEAVTRNFSGLQAINWVNQNGIVEWVAPVEPNIDALGKNLLEHELASPYLMQAMETGDIYVTGHLELLQGGDGFAVYVPVPAGTRSSGGFVNMVARVQPMLDVCLAQGVRDDFDLIITQNGDLIYATSDVDIRTNSLAVTASSGILNQQWGLVLAPKAHVVAAGQTLIDEAALAVGLLVTGLGCWLMRSMLIARSVLRERDQQIASIMDRLPGAAYCYIFDENTHSRTPVYFSDLSRLVGPATAATVGNNPDRWIELCHPEDDPIRLDAARSAMVDGDDVHFETRMRTDNGYRWMLALGRIDAIGNGRFRCHGLMLDVDERRRADEALRRSERLQSTIMRSSPDYVLLLDRDGRIQYMNRTVPELDIEEMIGQEMVNYLPEEKREEVRRLIREVAETGTERRYEFTSQYDSGPRRAFESIIAPVIEGGEVVSMVKVTRDVTEQRAATQQLWEQEQLLHQAAIIGNIGSWRSDLSGRPGGITWSDECYNIFGIDRDQFDGTRETFMHFVHPDDRDAVTAALDACIRDRSPYSVDHRIVRPDGVTRWLHEQGEPIVADDGTVVGLIGLCQDVTERRRTTEALQLVAEAVSSEIGESFFKRLVLTLADVLAVSHALVGRVSADDPTVIETIAVCSDGNILENFSYSLTGTPCADVIGGELCVHSTDVQAAFPDDALLIDMGVEGYAGMPLLSSDGSPIGLLVVLNTKPIEHVELLRALLRVMAVRAATELEREAHLQLLRESEERYRAFIAGSPEAVWRFTYETPIDTKLPVETQARLIYERGVLAECNEAYARHFGCGSPEQLIKARLKDLRPDYEVIRPSLEMFVKNGYRSVEREVHDTDHAGRPRVMIHNAHGVVEGGMLLYTWGTYRDVTEQRRAQQRQQLLMRELDHRVKNNLAAILSLAQQSMREADSIEEFGTAFAGRIAAMSRTHEALASSRWEGVHMRAVIETSLAPFVAEEQIASCVDGRNVILPARAAMPVCLTLHELATNAAKHGALREPGGRLEINWTVEDACVVLHWREYVRDAPCDPAPAEGLGLRLIRGLISHEIAGNVELNFTEAGLSCTLTIPLTESRTEQARTPIDDVSVATA